MPAERGKNAKKHTQPTRNTLLTTILPNLDKVTEWARAGATMAEIAKKLGVGYSTLRHHAAGEGEENLALRRALMAARAVADDAVEAKLFRRACGYAERKTVWEEKVTKDGEVVRLKKQVLVTQPPDTTAAMFWLTNRRAEQWKYRPQGIADERQESGIVELPTVEDEAAAD